MVKLIALDLDGTLLNSRKQISPGNKAAIRKAVEKGIHVVICTGRPIMGIRGFLEELDLVSENNYCVTFNGGLVQVTGTQEILSSCMLSHADAVYMYEELFKVGLPLNIIDLEKVYEPTYPDQNPSLYPVYIKNLIFEKKELSEFGTDHLFCKGMSCSPEYLLNPAIEALPKAFTDRFTIAKSRPIFLEVLPKGLNKSVGLESLCQKLGIDPSEVMTLGDEENDLEMIRWAGKGIAMANATPEVKAVAFDTTLTNDEDGVAAAIEKYAL